MKIERLLFFILFAYSLQVSAQSSQQRMEGPVIKGYGSTFKVAHTDFKTDTTKEYKVIFDVHDIPDNPGRVNPMLNTLARFLNMHVGAGVPLGNLKVACVIHNKASVIAMNNEDYKAQFGVDNPNIPLMEALEDAGAAIYMCGQSIQARGLDQQRLAEPVQVALSAMTVILSLQEEGFQLIKF